MNNNELPTYTYADGHACSDCVLAELNGDTSSVSATWNEMEWATGRRFVLFADESWFDVIPCDICGETLHGDRYPVTYL